MTSFFLSIEYFTLNKRGSFVNINGQGIELIFSVFDLNDLVDFEW